VVLRALWIGHYEFVIPLLILLQLVALAYRNRLAIALATVVLLAAREDAGFHAFAFLSLAIAVRRIFERRSWSSLRPELVTAAACLAYSIFCFAVVMPALQAFGVFKTIFAGDPPWAHLDRARIVEIAEFHALHNPRHILWPALLSLAAAVALQWPMLAVAALAPLPWTLLHFVAADTQSAYLAHYKAFPWMLLYAWPVFVAADAAIRGESGTHRHARSWKAAVAVLQVAVIALGLLPWKHVVEQGRGWSVGLHACARDRAAYDAFRVRLARLRPALGATLVSPGVLRYAPDVFDSSEGLAWYDPRFHQRVHDTAPQTIVFLAHGRGAIEMRRAALLRGWSHFYAARGTGFLVARAEPLADAAADAAGVAPIEPDATYPACFPSR
jgi:hypothetical protein